MKIVIIGASFSGVHCALKAKELYPYDEVILIEKEEELGYLPSGLTLLLNKEIASLDEANFISKEQIVQSGIHLMLGICVKSFDFTNQSLSTTDGEVFYDRLVLAMGSSQFSQKLMSEHTGFLTYKKKKEALNAFDKLNETDQVAVIGAGQAGMELASALVHCGKRVTLVESMDYPLYKSFDKEFIEPLVASIKRNDSIETLFGQTVREITDNKTLRLVTQQKEIESEAIFLATNVRPNLAIFEGKLDYHVDQTLKVDHYFETSEPNVFAIGDLIQVPSLLLDQTVYLPLINNAIRSGTICAENLKEKQTEYLGSIRIIGTKVFDYYLASCGLTEADSFLYEGQVATVTINAPFTIAETEPVRVKFTYNQETGVLLGTQIMSKQNILDKINTYALAIDMKMTIKELAQKDYFYHPSYTNPLIDMPQLEQRGV
ncbi:FAD-dependent oxidoreductase [Vagococcus fluvialis]|uniref:FAD-dependent oxidoreductase n=1 Tax=Vagococcus fluvialis TaxID=2738 RepID=UPI003B5BF56A